MDENKEGGLYGRPLGGDFGAWCELESVMALRPNKIGAQGDAKPSSPLMDKSLSINGRPICAGYATVIWHSARLVCGGNFRHRVRGGWVPVKLRSNGSGLEDFASL